MSRGIVIGQIVKRFECPDCGNAHDFDLVKQERRERRREAVSVCETEEGGEMMEQATLEILTRPFLKEVKKKPRDNSAMRSGSSKNKRPRR